MTIEEILTNYEIGVEELRNAINGLTQEEIDKLSTENEKQYVEIAIFDRWEYPQGKHYSRINNAIGLRRWYEEHKK